MNVSISKFLNISVNWGIKRMCEISIVIPCYNSFSLMNECLNSLEKQTFKNFEVIIIDDCSTDDTYEQLNNYRKNSKLNVKLFRNSKNIGPGPSRNFGIKVAMGKYITFLDSDDYLATDCLQRIIYLINKYQCDCVIFDYFIKQNNHVIKRSTISKNISGIIDKSDALVYSSGSTCGKVYTTNLLIKYDITFTNHKRNEDMPFTKCAISVCNKIYYYNYPLYYYVMQPYSLMHDFNLLDEKNAIQAFDIIERRLKSNYKFEIEAIFVKEYIYSTTLTLIKKKLPVLQVKRHIDECFRRYPACASNKFVKAYPKYLRVCFWLIKHKAIKVLQLVVYIKELIKKIGGVI